MEHEGRTGGFGPPALHGRRTAKPLSAAQRELVRDVLPRLALDPTTQIARDALFETPKADLWLEIGFGGGEHLLAHAHRHPDIGLIGCEPFLNGMARVLTEIAASGLTNIRLHDGDAGEIVKALPEGSVGRVFILYPDPWPKRRHRKRRFISDEMLVRLARIMRPGAELRFASDIDDYSGWTLARLLRSPHFTWVAETCADWQLPWADWASTRYEKKALSAGRRGCYITAIRG